MCVCVCVFVCVRQRESVCVRCCSCLSVSVFVCQCASVRVVVVFVLFFQGRGSVNVSPTLLPHLFTETSSLSQFIFGQGSVGWFLNCKKFSFFQSLSFKSGTLMLRTSSSWKHEQQSVRPTALPANGSPVCAQLVCLGGKAAIGRPSAAGGGRDRAMVQVGRVHHRNREVENEWRGGCGWCWGGRRWGLGPEQRAHCGGCFCGARGGEELWLELQQLAHEAEVGGDDAATSAHELEGFVKAHALSLHQVSKADGGWAGDACLTMDQHPPTGVSYGIWGERGSEIRGFHGQIKELDLQVKSHYLTIAMDFWNGPWNFFLQCHKQVNFSLCSEISQYLQNRLEQIGAHVHGSLTINLTNPTNKGRLWQVIPLPS